MLDGGTMRAPLLSRCSHPRARLASPPPRHACAQSFGLAGFDAFEQLANYLEEYAPWPDAVVPSASLPSMPLTEARHGCMWRRYVPDAVPSFYAGNSEDDDPHLEDHAAADADAFAAADATATAEAPPPLDASAGSSSGVPASFAAPPSRSLSSQLTEEDGAQHAEEITSSVQSRALYAALDDSRAFSELLELIVRRSQAYTHPQALHPTPRLCAASFDPCGPLTDLVPGRCPATRLVAERHPRSRPFARARCLMCTRASAASTSRATAPAATTSICSSSTPHSSSRSWVTSRRT